MSLLRRVGPGDPVLEVRRRPVEPDTLAAAACIVEEVRAGGEVALRSLASRLDELADHDPLVIGRDELEDAFHRLPRGQRDLLERVAARIAAFARAQLTGLSDLETEVPGGRAGHRWLPVSTVGAYAPGGRNPLPSSVLMTVVPARVAGVDEVWVSSPRPTRVSLGAAWVAGADGLLPVGGAHAIASLAFGTVTPAVDLVVGPGNQWVTAAKKHLFGEVGIDGLAGPSEIAVLADGEADPSLVAADLLAQAEHDPDAFPVLVTDSALLADQVEVELRRMLADLPTAKVATAALSGGLSVVVGDISEMLSVVNRLAPEHVALHTSDPDVVLEGITSYGSVFLGPGSTEAFADYGAGPNHVLPTGGGARFQSGLSVLTFLRSPTWLRLDRPTDLVADTALLARLEGLEAHARAAEARLES